MTRAADAATVSVPATSANLGPGYDALGAALELRDEYRARVSATPGVRVTVEGEGEGRVPLDAENLVAASMLRCFEHLGEEPPAGVEIHCRNAIPHGRGLGSSSAAIVGGLALARALSTRGDEMPDYALLEFATELEGHPDNAAPAVMGGFTLTWVERGVGRAVRLQPSPGVVPLVAVAPTALATEVARKLMPAEVPLADAVFNAGRSALLCHALTTDPELLLPATADHLHQERRSLAYPESYALLGTLRERGLAAVISGAGPSVLVLAYPDAGAALRDMRRQVGGDWRVLALEFAGQGLRVELGA